MSSAWTVLWSPKEVRNARTEGVLAVLGSNHFGRRPIKSGDTIWVVYSPKRGKLHALGSLKIADPMNRPEAVRRYGDDLFARKWFVRARNGRPTPVREVDVTAAARAMRFAEARPGSEKLRFGAGAPALGHQLRALRKLTPVSARRLAKAYGGSKAVDRDARAQLAVAVTKLTAGEAKREVWQRLEQAALRQILFRDLTEGTCVLCDEVRPIGLLVAGHLKRHSKCSKAEREDITNVAPMCIVGCDGLFERGMVTVVKGKLVKSFGGNVEGRLKSLLRTLDGKHVPSLWRRSKKYLEWHAAFHANAK